MKNAAMWASLMSDAVEGADALIAPQRSAGGEVEDDGEDDGDEEDE